MRRLVHVVILLLVFPGSLAGLEGQDKVLDSAEKGAVVEAVCENLEREYIFPDITEQYVRALRDNLRSGNYDGIEEAQDFARAITDDLESVHRDRHLHVQFNPTWVRDERNRKEHDQEAIELREWRNRTSNYGFRETEILPGNIGYLRFDSFSYDEDAYDVAIGAMSLLANTDALIIDLRSNGGGSPEMVQFLCSFFLDNPRKHLNSFTYRDREKLTQYWTYTYLPGKRLIGTDLYVLTSQNTFSAAEEFAYNLKSMERATIVGETTGGGGHDNKFVILTDRFMMSLPFARAVNPITHSNWEEVGVEPDVKVPRDRALETALGMASKSLSERENPPHIKAYHEWYHELYETALHPVTLDDEALQSYVGTYGPRTITLEDGSLFYQREGRSKMKMLPMADDVFMFDENDRFRIRFVREGNRVVAVEGRNPSGATDTHRKDTR
jgi:hypothetical protein